MSAVFETLNECYSVEKNIQLHAAWLGKISGLKAEKLLRGRKKPFLYILRAGEEEQDYYVTFVLPNFAIKHQPFTLCDTEEGWSFVNGGCGGPFQNAIIDDVLHLIMHCRKEELSAFVKA